MTKDEIITALMCCVSYDDSDCKLCPLQTNTEGLIALKTSVVDLIENQQRPTIDTVPVVRCRDCKHRFGTICAVCGLLPRKPEDFCSYGERKTGGDNDDN